MKQENRSEVKRLVREYKKHQERGEFRNKLGRIWWPIWSHFVVPGVSLCALWAFVTSGSIAGLVCGVSLWAICHPITKGFSVNVQNIAIRNAGVFGWFLRKRKIPFEIRRQAIVEYLKQSGAWFYNKKWMKENPESIDKMANGQEGKTIHNLVAFMESNMDRAVKFKKKQKKTISLQNRLRLAQQIYATFAHRGLKR